MIKIQDDGTLLDVTEGGVTVLNSNQADINRRAYDEAMQRLNLKAALAEYLREYMDILYHTGREEPDGHWWTRSMKDPQRLVQLIGLDMTRETFPASEVKEAMEEAIPRLVEEAAQTGRMV